MGRFSFLSLIFSIIFFFGCHDKKKSQDFQSEIIKSNQGVSPDTLDLIYDGPKGFTLVYFPRSVIQSAHISHCEIIDKDSTSQRIARKIWFDQRGNIVIDENNYFQYWFNGTVTGSYTYYYDSSNNLLKMVGIREKDRSDSIMMINNYTQSGLLYRRDRYEFAKKLKPGADKHLPQTSDFRKYPTWNKLESYEFSYDSRTIIVETILDGKTTEKEKYVLQFDSSGRLTATTKYADTTLHEITSYFYESNGITGSLRRKMNDGKEWTYNSKSLIGDKKNQSEKILFKDDSSEDVKMLTTYNADGTIGSIQYQNSTQIFKYTYY